MTRPDDLETFHGIAIHILRERRKWSTEKLAEACGLSPASILNYEKGRIVPRPNVRRRIARALDVPPSGLARLAADVQRGVKALEPQSGPAAAVAAGLADDFLRVTLPLVERLAAEQSAPPAPASREEVQALAPLVRRLATADLQSLAGKLPSLWGWEFVRLLGEESERAASVDARRALELARFSLWVAEQAPGAEGWLCRIFAWAFRSNAHRVLSDFAAAEEALTRSQSLRAEPPPDAPEIPEPWRLLDLEASLRISQRRLLEALRLLDVAAERAPRTGPVPARLLCKRSIALDRRGEMDAAIAALRQGLALIEPGTEPDLFCQLQSNLAKCLACAGRAAEAEAMLSDLRRMQAQLGNGLNQLRLQWLEGKIDAGLGRLDRAIETLSKVRAAFSKENLPYDEAQAGMELARLYLEKGRTSEVKRLVREMKPVFEAKGVHTEAKKALDLFREAVEQERATAALASQVAAYLRRAEHDPELVFQEAA